MSKLSKNGYVAVGKVSSWLSFITANQFLEEAITMVTEDRVTSKLDMNSFKETLTQIEHFYDNFIVQALKNPIE